VADVGFDAVASLVRSGRRGAVVTVIAGPGLGAKLLATADEVVGSLGDAELDARAAALARELIPGEESGVREAGGRALFVDVHTPQPHLLVIGAVDFTAALARLARVAGFRVTVVDARTHFATAERIPDAHEIVVAWPHDYLAEHPPDDSTYVAVLTHEPRFDDPTLTAVLKSPARYIGAMGSRRAHGERLERLRADGWTEEDLARIWGPIGLDIGAATTEETAISILAEIIAVRHGRSGGRLSERTKPVHELTEREHLFAAEARAHTPTPERP
jgi:xanthine dehydrogenase accessory factor